MMKITLHKNFCVVEPQGPLTKEDFNTIASQVDPIIEQDGKLDGLIIKTREFPGWETFGDVVAHFRFVKHHHQMINKVALVTDAKVVDVVPPAINHFVKADVKHFAFNDYEKAVEWIC